MSTKEHKPNLQLFTEHCEGCGETTPHEVSIQLVTESKKRSNAEFSREPYRVSICTICHDRQSKRMNNA